MLESLNPVELLGQPLYEYAEYAEYAQYETSKPYVSFPPFNMATLYDEVYVIFVSTNLKYVKTTEYVNLHPV